MRTLRRTLSRLLSLLSVSGQARPDQKSASAPPTTDGNSSGELDRERLAERAQTFKKDHEQTFRQMARE